MSEIKTVLTCPLGAKCEEIKDGAIHRCAWYTKLAGTNMQQRSTSAAVESFRNETVQANQTTQQILLMQARPKDTRLIDNG